MSEKRLEDLMNLIESLPSPFEYEEGDYAEFVDESDTTGPVQICNKSGRVKVIMPLEVWDDLRKKGAP